MLDIQQIVASKAKINLPFLVLTKRVVFVRIGNVERMETDRLNIGVH
jgi:hypothetical protein